MKAFRKLRKALGKESIGRREKRVWNDFLHTLSSIPVIVLYYTIRFFAVIYKEIKQTLKGVLK